jgi:hypothetical protein
LIQGLFISVPSILLSAIIAFAMPRVSSGVGLGG